MSKIGYKKCLWLKKLDVLYHGHMGLMILVVKILQERSMKRLEKGKSIRI